MQDHASCGELPVSDSLAVDPRVEDTRRARRPRLVPEFALYHRPLLTGYTVTTWTKCFTMRFACTALLQSNPDAPEVNLNRFESLLRTNGLCNVRCRALVLEQSSILRGVRSGILQEASIQGCKG